MRISSLGRSSKGRVRASRSQCKLLLVNGSVWESTGKGNECSWDSELKSGRRVWRADAEGQQDTGNIVSRS